MPTPRRRLTSDTLRHSICMVLMVVVMVVPITRAAVSPRVEELLTVARTFVAFAAYGLVYLVLTVWAFRGLQGQDLRDELHATRPPRSGWVRWLFVAGPRSWAIALSFMAMTAVLTLSIAAKAAPVWLSLSGIGCVLGTWILLIAVFAGEYARLWADGPSFRFPDGDEHRTFGDFVYASVQLSTTFSSSDVEVLGREARGAVTVHSLTAWAYSTVVIALVVSLALPS